MALRVVRVVMLVVLTIALGVGVLFCVTRVGTLNSHAAILKSCQTAPGSQGCPSIPVNDGQVSSLTDEASTIGALGWIAFGVLALGVGGTAIKVLSSD